MSSQLNMFGPATEDQLSYQMRFEEVVRKFPRGHLFTTDDVTAVVGLPSGDHNQIGSIIRSLAERGLIEFTGQTANAMRPGRHAGMIRIWRRR